METETQASQTGGEPEDTETKTASDGYSTPEPEPETSEPVGTSSQEASLDPEECRRMFDLFLENAATRARERAQSGAAWMTQGGATGGGVSGPRPLSEQWDQGELERPAEGEPPAWSTQTPGLRVRDPRRESRRMTDFIYRLREEEEEQRRIEQTSGERDALTQLVWEVRQMNTRLARCELDLAAQRAQRAPAGQPPPAPAPQPAPQIPIVPPAPPAQPLPQPAAPAQPLLPPPPPPAAPPADPNVLPLTDPRRWEKRELRARFDGDPKRMPFFLTQVAAFMRTWWNTFQDERSQVEFVIAHLDSSAADWAFDLMASQGPELDSLPDFLRLMQRRFRDTLQTQRAMEGIRKSRQGQRRIEDWVAEFRSLARQIPEWPEAYKIQLFREAIHPELRVLAILQPKPTTLEGWFQLVTRLEGDRAELRLDCPNYTGFLGHPRKEPKTTATTPTVAKGATPASREAEKLRRRKEGLCLYCGQAGHLIANCPQRTQATPGKPPGGTKTTTSKAKDTTAIFQEAEEPTAPISSTKNQLSQAPESGNDNSPF